MNNILNVIDAPDIDNNFDVYVESTPTYNNMIMEVEDKIQNGLFPEIIDFRP